MNIGLQLVWFLAMLFGINTPFRFCSFRICWLRQAGLGPGTHAETNAQAPFTMEDANLRQGVHPFPAHDMHIRKTRHEPKTNKQYSDNCCLQQQAPRFVNTAEPCDQNAEHNMPCLLDIWRAPTAASNPGFSRQLSTEIKAVLRGLPADIAAECLSRQTVCPNLRPSSARITQAQPVHQDWCCLELRLALPGSQDVREVVQQSVRRHRQSEQVCAHWRSFPPPAKD